MTTTAATNALAEERLREQLDSEPRWRRWRARFGKPEAIVTFVVVAACVAFTFKELQPSQLFKNTTPAGGDMGAHVWLPAYVKRALLPHLRLMGWTPDWYEGFPALTYYFPGPIVAIAVLSYIIPYDIAFKLISVLGLVTLPVAAWGFGRLARMRFPGPACLAAASVPFLFCREFTIYGGNIASTMAGEFSFSISLSLALVFLGLVARGIDTGKHRALAALCLAATGVSHILPLFFAIGGALVLTVMRIDLHDRRASLRRILEWTFPVLVIGGALMAFWAIPFELRLPYATNMGYQKVTQYVSSLFPGGDAWLFVLAAIGIILSLARRNRIGTFLSIMTVLAGLVFVLAPQNRLWNARVLPFWFLCLYLLAGVAFCEVGTVIVESVRQRPFSRPRSLVPVPIVTLLVALVWVNYPLHNLPFGHTTASGDYDWLGIKSSDTSFIPSWVYWNYSGYQNSGKTREAEYFALVNAMKSLGQQDGCGTALWEYEPELDQMGTPDALMLLPYWTNGCIGSEEGLYYESSASTPYHFLNVAEVSDQPSNPVRGLNYPSGPDVAEAVQHMQIMGVKYFMAETPDVEAAADKDSDLRLLTTVGPYPVTYTNSAGTSSSTKQRTWKIYQVLGSSLVTPLAYQPAVVSGVSQGGQAWLNMSQAWYLNPAHWNVYLAASGPQNWAHVGSETSTTPLVQEPPVTVSNIKQETQSISFDVDQVGVPILVHESYYPNWQVSGAKGPYRVTPNLMVVIPTSTHVTLTYGYTTLDWISFIFSLLGLLGLVLLWKLPPANYPVVATEGEGTWRFGIVSLGGGLRDARGGRAKVPKAMDALDDARLAAVFKAYDIRGTVPDQLDPALAWAVGAAFARFAGTPTVVVARDMRPSGPALVEAFAGGVTSTGTDVVDLGLASTDELYFASGHLNAPGAMFTASHNPAQYNGIKLCLAGARPVGVDTGLRHIRDTIASGFEPPAALTPGTVTRSDVLLAYVEKVRSFVDLAELRPLKVVADTANGMGGLVVPAVFDGLPFELDILFGDLDGTFPNHPADPIQPENLVALRERILQTGADVGLAFDGDADRCFLVDDQGVPVSGSTTTAIVAAALLDRHPGATILHNLICSKAVPEIVRELGGVPVRTRVGHSYIKAVMADTDALFGGEHSGHYYFRENFRADSGCVAALVVLEVLSRAARPLSEIRQHFERYADSGEINTEVTDPSAVIEAISSHYADARQDRLDGLTVDLGTWWFNVRPSNTEPLLRLNLEAADAEECARRTEEVLSLIKEHAGGSH